MRQATPQTKSRSSIFLHQRLREGLFILSIGVALFLLLSLLTYHRTDPGWSRVGQTEHIANAGGRVGAWCADILLYVFGYFAYLFPIAFVYSSWLYLRQDAKTANAHTPKITGWHWIGFMLILSAGSGLISLHFGYTSPHLPYKSGGILGAITGFGLANIFNSWGSTLLLFALFLCGFSFFTGISWLNCLDLTGRGVLLLLKWCRNRLFSLRVLMIRAKPQREVRQAPIIDVKSTPATRPLPRMEPSEPSAPKAAAPEIVAPKPKVTPTRKVVATNTSDALPPLNLLDAPESRASKTYSHAALEQMSHDVENKLRDFGVDVQVVAVHPGPVITRFELQLAPGIKVSKISGLNKDLARSLSVVSVRIVEVIPGKSVVGLELPNDNREIVRLSEVLTSQQYAQARSPLSLALGKDIAGHPVVVDLAKMPHLLVAGTTGSGKSVGLNAMLLSMLYKSTPEDVRLIMIDPKMLELSIYDGIAHLLTPVVTDMKEAANALRWCISEMDRRYRIMAHLGVRNLAGYNHKVKEALKQNKPIPNPYCEPPNSEMLQPLPFIVVLIDEFADMMLVVGKKVEDLIARLAQKARAAGIHLILATQRPSVDVITGLIKANVPTRIGFQVSSKIDSRTILDQSGAEQLLGYGDMLYLAPGTGVPVRIHGAFVADHEVHSVVNAIKQMGEPDYCTEILQDAAELSGGEGAEGEAPGEMDPLYDQAVRIVTETRRASISSVQRRLKIGYNRAARMLEEMERAGIVSQMQGNGNREVLAAPPPAETERY